MQPPEHTPGPWSIHKSNMVTIEDSNRQGICQPLHPWTMDNDAEFEANARLIAAAPDLLEQMRQLRILLSNLIFDAKSNRPWSPQAADNLRLAADDTDAVLNKATGKETA